MKKGSYGELPPRCIEEASAWLALLHGPRRGGGIVRGFQRWIAEDSQHRRAFEAVTAMWELTERLPKRPMPLPLKWQRQGFRFGLVRATTMVAAVSVVAIAVGLTYFLRAGVSTDVGEQRILTLEDGTRVYLNTASQIRVRFTDERRALELVKGEALFEVAKRPEWPFAVRAGEQQIIALGTSFVVRRDAGRVAVTLVEGSVSVSSTTAEKVRAENKVHVLTPGERLTVVSSSQPRIDRPELEKVIAWRRGRVDLNDMSLSEAIAEMNRYTSVKLTVEQGDAVQLMIKGSFRAGDTASFAQSVASICELRVVSSADGIVLSGVPAANCR